MNLGLFSTLVGLLLPLGMILRLLVQSMREELPPGHPLALWRLQLALLLAIPLAGSMAPAWMFVTAVPNRIGSLAMQYLSTPWGIIRAVLIVIAVIAIDLSKPRMTEQLGAEPTATARPTLLYIARDIAMIAISLALAWAATWSGR